MKRIEWTAHRLIQPPVTNILFDNWRTDLLDCFGSKKFYQSAFMYWAKPRHEDRTTQNVIINCWQSPEFWTCTRRKEFGSRILSSFIGNPRNRINRFSRNRKRPSFAKCVSTDTHSPKERASPTFPSFSERICMDKKHYHMIWQVGSSYENQHWIQFRKPASYTQSYIFDFQWSAAEPTYYVLFSCGGAMSSRTIGVPRFQRV